MFIFSVWSCQVLAQKNWTVHQPFIHKEFIENKGQVQPVKGIDEPVLFTAHLHQYNYYFTPSGFYVSERILEKEKENKVKSFLRSITAKSGVEKEKEEYFDFHERVAAFHWENTNAGVIVSGEDKVKHYYAYAVPGNDKLPATVHAGAFKRIVYKNIYPYIDLYFEFSDTSNYIKYSLYLHEGAVIENIKLKCPSSLKQTKGGVAFATALGQFMQTNPLAYVNRDKKTVDAKFAFSGRDLTFDLQHKIVSETIVIDPWIVTPTFTGGNDRAFDVDYDSQGNVYVYGKGAPQFQLMKYDPTGSLVWIFTCAAFTGYPYYGDFAIDRSSDRIYIVEGLGISPGAEVVKINALAVTEAFFSGAPSFYEMWRIAFSHCTNQAVVCGGGTGGSYQTCYLDTNLTTLTPVSYASGSPNALDAGLLDVDDLGNTYQFIVQGSSGSSLGSPMFANTLFKLPLPAMAPTTWMVSTPHKFQELYSMLYYYPGMGQYSNGYNGMATYANKVYTYDAYALIRWDGNTGAMLDSIGIDAVAGVAKNKWWGGLSADDCGNVFVGDSMRIRLFDSSLAETHIYPLPDFVYDVKYDRNNTLLACGKGFVTSIDVSGHLAACYEEMDVSIEVHNECGQVPYAVAFVTGGANPVVSWNTSPVTINDTLYNPSAGDYIVTVSDGKCNGMNFTDTITILPSVNFTASYTVNTILCPDNNASASIEVSITGGAGPFSYQWSNAAADTNVLTNLPDGTYTVVITGASLCSDTLVIPVNAIDPLHIENARSGSECTVPNSGYIAIDVEGGTAPYTYAWDGLAANGNSVTGLPGGTYSVTVTDVNNCTVSAAFEVTGILGQVFNAGLIPTVFTPNGDGKNDRFTIVDPLTNAIDDFSLKVFNRWGVLLFETTVLTEQWDGTFNGKPVPEGVYYWVGKGLDKCSNHPLDVKGTVHLSR